jgi:hypothetical protein
MTKDKALEIIEKEYGTLDTDEVYLAAANKRVGTEHTETPMRDGTSRCMVCGVVDDNPDADPRYHPEKFL